MPEPLKNLYNREFISELCKYLQLEIDTFDTQRFTASVFDDEWNRKELKQRMQHISSMLQACWPDQYRKAIGILKPVSGNFSGLQHMIFPSFVELFGIDDFETSMQALEYFTSNSSSEFAVRPYIKRYPAETMQQMEAWASSSNEHVRRLASEGCRPRLPWAMALPAFKKDPAPVIRILNILKNDESEYVRRSVANNLNDISKDHPGMVVEIARQWLGDNKATDRLVKHACRSLLKQGEPRLLETFGFKKPDHIEISGFVVQNCVDFGGELAFSFRLQTQNKKLGKLRIEYAIDFMKHNGTRRRKIFQVSESESAGTSKTINKRHSFKPISTRKYYPGGHGLAVLVNGVELVCADFQLKVPD
jgi:3-methyladenine DNA glycosylase AlkC